jgi:hypothetical protein
MQETDNLGFRPVLSNLRLQDGYTRCAADIAIEMAANLNDIAYLVMETIPFTFNGSSKMPYFKSATVTGGFVK